MKKENELILLSCLQTKTDNEKNNIKEIVATKLDWGYIVGQLVHHRLSGYFISYLTEYEKKYLYKEVKKQLVLIYKMNKVITIANMKYMSKIFEQFEKQNITYAGLKGVIYNTSMYEIGVRRSNDIDILVPEPELRKVDEILRSNGFIQSVNSNREEATKKDKIIQRLNFHDLIPYYKNIDNSILVPYYKLDINFRVDNEKDGLTKKFFDYGTQIYEREGFRIRGLRWQIHLLHLCIHFYREVSHIVWVKDKRDCMLYKLVDIENTIRFIGTEKLISWFEEMTQFHCDEDIFTTFYYLNELYPNDIYRKLLNKINIDESVPNKIKIKKSEESVMRDESYIKNVFDLRYCIDFSKK